MSNFKHTLIGLCLAFFSTVALAQDATISQPEKQLDFGLEGMIGLSYGSETIGINVGGPSLKFRFNKFKVGVGCFPSLIVVDNKAFPKLAVSPIVEYRNIMFIMPYYGYDSKDKAIWTFGLGYKFF